MIQARLTIFAQPSQREELVRSIYRLIESSRLDSGCLDCRLYSDVANPDAITLVEEWATQPDMERRLRSTAYGQLLQLLEVSREPPETIFHTIIESSGLETIRNVRLPVD
jgi:quinol monooxygenase YgiN